MLPDYVIGAELPDWKLFVSIDGQWQDWSSGWTGSVKVAPRGSLVASFTTSAGITLGVGTAENAANPVPSAIVGWSVTGLSSLAAGPYTAQFTATRTADAKNVIIQEPFNMVAVIV
jgi:hypothetical protein